MRVSNPAALRLGLLFLLVGLLAAPRPARADPRPEGQPAPDPVDVAPIDPQARVIVVFVGATSMSSTLAPLLIELLGRTKVTVTFASAPRFDPARLLSGGGDDRAVSVFVTLDREHSARLYFRGPQGGSQAPRFLLRDLELRDGLDELGCELIGQVVESSVIALLHSSAGLSREEARAALAEPTPAAVEETRPPPAAPRISALGAWLGLRYGGAWQGSALGLAEGPGVEVGLQYRARALFRAVLSVERSFAQSVETPDVTASVQSWPLRLSAYAGWPADGANTWFAGLAAGADVTQIEPSSRSDSAVTLSPASTHVVPVFRAALRYERGVDRFRLACEVFADVAAFDTHYDLQITGAGSERLARPWLVRPGVALVLAWEPAL